jgi:hypothetical protein
MYYEGGVRWAGEDSGWLADLIHQQQEREWRSSRDGRKRSCGLRLFHRWDLMSGQALEVSDGFGGTIGRPRGLRCSGHQPGCDG